MRVLKIHENLIHMIFTFEEISDKTFYFKITLYSDPAYDVFKISKFKGFLRMGLPESLKVKMLC